MRKFFRGLSIYFAYFRAKSTAEDERSKKSDSEIGAESPIKNSSEDKLRRTQFSDRIAHVLSDLTLQEGRVFAIRGGWGFGKSSLKNLITERLDKLDKEVIWLDFNPWKWGDSDAIAKALFAQMANRIGGKHSKEALARAKAFRRYGAILTGAANPLKAAGKAESLISFVLTNISIFAIVAAIGFNIPAVAIVAAFFAFLSLAFSFFGRILSFIGRDYSGESLDEVRADLEERLKQLDGPLVVFVDDIDRLEPEQIRVLLRQVKANANLPNIVFVLLFQPNIVEQALSPVASGDGRAFLEKIVQVNFDMPAVPASTVHQLFGQELSVIAEIYATESNGFSDRRWGNALIGSIQPFVRNMRDSRRLISSIAVHMPLHVIDDVFEVNIIDFFVLETLRVFEPNLHSVMFKERSLLLKFGKGSRHDRTDDKSAVNALLEMVSERNKAAVRDALRNLFPNIEWALGGTNYGDGFEAQWLSEKRVCTSRYFPRYFELQAGVGEITERRFINFIDATETEDELSREIASIEEENLLASLIARLDESVDRLPVANANHLLPKMFEIAQKAVDEYGNNLGSPFVSAWRAIVWYLKRIPENIRGKLAIDALSKTQALTVASIVISLSDPADRREDETDDPALDFKTVVEMKTLCLEILRRRAELDNTLIDDPDLLSLLYQWKSYSGSSDEPKKWVMKKIRKNENFAKIANQMMSRGRSHTSGDRISVAFNRFRKEAIEEFIGIDNAKSMIKKINPAEFPEQEEILRELDKQLEMWSK